MAQGGGGFGTGFVVGAGGGWSTAAQVGLWGGGVGRTPGGGSLGIVLGPLPIVTSVSLVSVPNPH